MIKNITQKLECTTVVTSHDMYNASRIADRLVLIHDGKVLIKGTVEDLKNSKDAIVKDFFV